MLTLVHEHKCSGIILTKSQQHNNGISCIHILVHTLYITSNEHRRGDVRENVLGMLCVSVHGLRECASTSKCMNVQVHACAVNACARAF